MFANWFRQFKAGDDKGAELPLYLEEASQHSQAERDELFESYLSHQDSKTKFFPGRFGGKGIGDKVACVFREEGRVDLFLGIKVTEPDGSLQLDIDSDGNMQFSKSWLESLVQRLAVDSNTRCDAEALDKAWKSGTLLAAILLVKTQKPNKGELDMLRIALPES